MKELKKTLIFLKPHPLTKFEIVNYYKNNKKFNGVYSRDNWPKIKNDCYVIDLDEYENTGTHWIAFYVKNNKVIYFDSFGVEYILKEVKKFIENDKEIKTNIYKIQHFQSIMCGYYCAYFCGVMFKDKNFIDFTNLFSPYDFKKMMLFHHFFKVIRRE